MVEYMYIGSQSQSNSAGFTVLNRHGIHKYCHHQPSDFLRKGIFMDRLKDILDSIMDKLRHSFSNFNLDGIKEFFTSFDLGKLKKWLSRINYHFVFLGAVVLIVAIILLRLNAWNKGSQLESISSEDAAKFDTETLDNFVPYTQAAAPKNPEDMVIACFGNAPFADDRNSSDNLANMIADKTGATVYNFSFADSYLSQTQPVLQPGHIDTFSLYWLTTIWAVDNDILVDQYLDAVPNAPMETRATLSLLQNLDFNTVDVIAIMYDGSDYLDCRGMYNRGDPTNLKHFGGALNASLQLIQQYYPDIQIIVMSPTYAYGLEEDGTLVDSTIKTYGEEGPLASYVQYQHEVAYNSFVTFIDNFYGAVTYFNAKDLLTDHIHLNVEGRKLVADRFMEGFDYYLKYRNKAEK